MDSKDAFLFKKWQDKDRVYNFFVGLNRELDEVWGWLLGLHPLPSSDKVFAKVYREEHHHHVILGDSQSFQVDSPTIFCLFASWQQI